MKFSVKRNALLTELSLVQGVVEKRSPIPILSNILIACSGEDLDITATDLDVTIRCGCPALVEEEGVITVPARRLFDIVRLLPEGSDLEFQLVENDMVELRSGSSRFKVVALPRENFPSIPEGAPGNMMIPGNLLKSMIQRVMFAITQEEARFSLNGALLVLFPSEIRMVATDGHRLALVSKGIEMPDLETEVRVLVPRKALVEILKLLGDQDVMVEFARDQNHLFFSVGNKRIVSRALASQFPNYELVIPRDNDKFIVAETKILGDAIRRASVMSDERLKAIRLSIKSGAIDVMASSSEAGEAHETIPAEYEGESMDIGFNPLYLLDFINVCASDSISIALKDSETQGLFRPVGGSDLDYRYVVMPMKF